MSATPPSELAPIRTRVGLILADDNRFFGDSTFHGWAHRAQAPSDLVLCALGVELDPRTRELARIVAVATTSPDARVWPLKLTRILASHGDAAAAHFGAQLVSTGRTMGPGTVTHAAHLLSSLRAEGASSERDALVGAIEAARARYGGRLPGFGVPFRAQDERFLGMRGLLDGRAELHGPHWRTMLRVLELVPVAPNAALAVAALLLDIGLAPTLCGLGLSLLMTHVFLGHAVEAAETDAVLRALPPTVVDYQGPPRRALPG